VCWASTLLIGVGPVEQGLPCGIALMLSTRLQLRWCTRDETGTSEGEASGGTTTTGEVREVRSSEAGGWSESPVGAEHSPIENKRARVRTAVPTELIWTVAENPCAVSDAGAEDA